YRRDINDFMGTPIGRALATIFFLWLALSGWLFRIFIFGTFVLPFAAPLLLGTFANRVAIEVRFLFLNMKRSKNILLHPMSNFLGKT
ncbi:hypothetical protein ACJX0J_007295, partial [Zea mays]